MLNTWVPDAGVLVTDSSVRGPFLDTSDRGSWVSRSGVYGLGLGVRSCFGAKVPSAADNSKLRTPDRRPQTGKPAILSRRYVQMRGGIPFHQSAATGSAVASLVVSTNTSSKSASSGGSGLLSAKSHAS